MTLCFKHGVKMAIKITLRKTEYTFEKEMTLKQLYKELNLIPESYLALRNGELLLDNEPLKDNDEIKLVAVISGGSL
jgi:sulfur carrier protein ThiS